MLNELMALFHAHLNLIQSPVAALDLLNSVQFMLGAEDQKNELHVCRTCIHGCTHACMCVVCMHVCVYVCMYVCIHE